MANQFYLLSMTKVVVTTTDRDGNDLLGLVQVPTELT